MKTVAVIPARYASRRFPGKPLACETGKYLIQHVYEAVCRCRRLDRIVVATDDDRIADAVSSFNGEVVKTTAVHPTGTDRVAEAVGTLRLSDDDLVLNVQGDEPEIDESALDRLIDLMQSVCPGIGIGTLAAPFPDDGPRTGPGSPLDPNCVKVAMDGSGRALYFSRSLVPYPRAAAGLVERPSRWMLHLGVYAFRVEALRRITGMPAAGDDLAATESLEQLRWLEHGLPVAVAVVGHAFVGIDTPEDYAAFVRRDAGRAADPAPPARMRSGITA